MSADLINTILRALPGEGRCMDIAALARTVGRNRKDVSRSCARLVDRHVIERVRPGCFRLTPAGVAGREAGRRLTSGPNGPLTGVYLRPKQSTFRGRVWKALRSMTKATIPDLVTVAATGNERDPEGGAYQYLRALEAKGVVVRLARREPGAAPTSPGFNRYLLVRDLGPLAPTIKGGGVFDPNSRSMVSRRCAPGGAEAAT
jgi:hypothetical protein